MRESRTPVLTGGCQCGAVRYALFAAPERTHLCHCRMCQRAMGNAFAALAPVRKTDIAWTCGVPAMFRSSPVAERGFCSACGTPLSFGYLESEWIDVTLGSLDEPERVAPEFHYGVESRLTWLDRLDRLPREETSLGGVTGGGGVVSNTHPLHDEPERRS